MLLARTIMIHEKTQFFGVSLTLAGCCLCIRLADTTQSAAVCGVAELGVSLPAEMNRHHYALYVHNCRLVFLLRKDFDQADTFRPAEFHWKLDQVPPCFLLSSSSSSPPLESTGSDPDPRAAVLESVRSLGQFHCSLQLL